MAPIYDGTGSTVWLVNSAGAIATQYTYEAYGKTTAALTASSNPFQFTGRELDPSGLYFMRNRYYSPTLSRFISSDPAGFGGGDVNLFRYAGGDPVNSSDPLGTVVVANGFSFADVSDFGVDGISFDFGPLLANLGLIFARNGAGLTGGSGLSGDRASLGEGGPPEDILLGPGPGGGEIPASVIPGFSADFGGQIASSTANLRITEIGELLGPPRGGWGPRPRGYWKLPPKSPPDPPTDLRRLLPRNAPYSTRPPLIPLPGSPVDIIPFFIPIQPFCDLGLCGSPMT